MWCCAKDVSSQQADISDQLKAANRAPDAEETVKGPVTPSAAKPGNTEKKESEGQEWTITLRKTPGSRLGVDVDLADGETLQVDTVNEGLVNDWNKANPSKEVRKDDRIISVNGVRGTATKLTDVCKSAEVLEMVVQRTPA
mmetsp:Transcript_70357/g.177329  ORF Transcript_70357/g.177329 Transcript_70357/m.177329 type:complete len:141 (-) Transcript_70357:36-458(-)